MGSTETVVSPFRLGLISWGHSLGEGGQVIHQRGSNAQEHPHQSRRRRCDPARFDWQVVTTDPWSATTASVRDAALLDEARQVIRREAGQLGSFGERVRHVTVRLQRVLQLTRRQLPQTGARRIAVLASVLSALPSLSGQVVRHGGLHALYVMTPRL